MFEHISRACGSKLNHKQHSKYEGFLWHRKVTCYGRDYAAVVERSSCMTPNEIRDSVFGFPKTIEVEEPEPDPHKHFYRYSGWHTDKTNARRLDQMITFRCIDCPESYEFSDTYVYCNPTDITIPRWKYLEMTLDWSKVDQTWPS